MNKKELAKCKAGTWLRIRWDDGIEAIGLLLQKIDRDDTGHILVKMYYPEPPKGVQPFTLHNNVVEVLGHVIEDSYQDMVYGCDGSIPF